MAGGVNWLVGVSLCLCYIVSPLVETEIIGDEGVRVWEVPSGCPVQIPDYDAATQGQVTVLKWVVGVHGGAERLLLGTALGHLALWQYDIAEVGGNRWQWPKIERTTGAL